MTIVLSAESKFDKLSTNQLAGMTLAYLFRQAKCASVQEEQSALGCAFVFVSFAWIAEFVNP